MSQNCLNHLHTVMGLYNTIYDVHEVKSRENAIEIETPTRFNNFDSDTDNHAYSKLGYS